MCHTVYFSVINMYATVIFCLSLNFFSQNKVYFPSAIIQRHMYPKEAVKEVEVEVIVLPLTR